MISIGAFLVRGLQIQVTVCISRCRFRLARSTYFVIIRNFLEKKMFCGTYVVICRRRREKWLFESELCIIGCNKISDHLAWPWIAQHNDYHTAGAEFWSVFFF